MSIHAYLSHEEIERLNKLHSVDLCARCELFAYKINKCTYHGFYILPDYQACDEFVALKQQEKES